MDSLLDDYSKRRISDLEAKLAEKEDRINWLVEAEFNRKWAKKYVEMRRKEDPMLCLPDSDEVYEKYFELKQQLTQKDKQLEKLKSENHALISDNAYQEADMFEFNSRIEQLQKQLAEKEKENKKLREVVDCVDMLKQFNANMTDYVLVNRDVADEIYCEHQDKISFAVEQLEKVLKTLEEQQFFKKEDTAYCIHPAQIAEHISNQIKQLKEME